MNEIKEKIKDLELALNYVCYDADLIPKLQTVWQKLELLQEVVNKNALSHSVSNPVICCENCQYYTEYECMLEYKCCINHDKFEANE